MSFFGNISDNKYLTMKDRINWDIIKNFSGKEALCFSFEDIIKVYPSKDKNYLAKILSKMAANGLIIRLSKGLYHIVPLNQDANSFIPDWHLVARYLMRDRKYYIGYYSAMHIHGLITQPSLKEIIVTNIQIKPSHVKVKNIDFQFVYHLDKRFFGFTDTWIDDYNKVTCSDLEKTLVDSLDKPHYSGDIVEIGKAIYETRDRISKDRLFSYLIQFESRVAIKRYLFLCDLLGIWSAFHEGLLVKIGNSISPLDTSAPDKGKANHRFGLRINIDIDSIKNSIFT